MRGFLKSLSNGWMNQTPNSRLQEKKRKRVKKKEKRFRTSATPSDVTNSRMPIGMKARPIKKNVGRTVPAVRIGCHALRRCCRNALPAIEREFLSDSENIQSSLLRFESSGSEASPTKIILKRLPQRETTSLRLAQGNI